MHINIYVAAINSESTEFKGTAYGGTTPQSMNYLDEVPGSNNTIQIYLLQLEHFIIVEIIFSEASQAPAIKKAKRATKSSHSNIISNEEPGVGIKETESIHLNLYPNPTTGIVFIKSDEQITKVELWTLSGTLILENDNVSNKIDISNLLQGVYFIIVQTEKGNYQERIIKK